MCIKLSISLLRCWLDPAKQCLAKVNQNIQNAYKPKNVYECQTVSNPRNIVDNRKAEMKTMLEPIVNDLNTKS